MSWRHRCCCCVCVCVSRRDVRQTVRDSVRVQCGGVSRQSSSLHQPELHLDRSSTRHRLRQLHVSHSHNNLSSCMWEKQNLMAWGNLWTHLTRGRFFTSEWVLKGSSHRVCIKHAKLPEPNMHKFQINRRASSCLSEMQSKQKTLSKAYSKAPHI